MKNLGGVKSMAAYIHGIQADLRHFGSFRPSRGTVLLGVLSEF